MPLDGIFSWRSHKAANVLSAGPCTLKSSREGRNTTNIVQRRPKILHILFAQGWLISEHFSQNICIFEKKTVLLQPETLKTCIVNHI